MSLNINGEKCALCKAYLFEEDDIVYCPECGAPHHRDCYNSIGHCALDDFHGTENQYVKPETQENDKKEASTENTIICGMCGEKYNDDEMVCPKCNTPNITKMGGHVVSYDFLGGVSEDTDLGEGVKAGEAKNFVASNTHRYIPKFLKFRQGKKVSWNWFAFFTPCGWLMSRKIYLLGAVVGALQIAFSVFAVPLTVALSYLDTSQVRTYIELSELILDNITTIGTTSIYVAAIGYILDLALRLIIAIFADFIYKKRVISTVSEIKIRNEDMVIAFRKKGGINLFAGVLGYLAVSELPTIITYILGIL